MSTKRQAEIRAERSGEEMNFTPNIAKKTSSDHYIKNSILTAELIKCKQQDELTPEAVQMFVAIATKLSNTMHYTNPDDRDDCISTAVLDCIKYWRNFDPEKTMNGFAYITSICKNGFAKGWRQLGKMQLPDSKKVSLSDNIYNI